MRDEIEIECGDRFDEIIIHAECKTCKKKVRLLAPLEGYNKWLSGQIIQRAFPSMEAVDRELLISGTCSTCFDEMFGGEDEA